jgi:DNA-binding LytR/AlgR family response regulator
MNSASNVAATSSASNIDSMNIDRINADLSRLDSKPPDATKVQQAPENGTHARKLKAVPLEMTASRFSTRIAIRAKRKILLINPADVIAVEAQGNYVLVRQISSSHLLRESISMMEEKLSPHGFVRIHRSVLVNRACVEEIRPWSTGEYVLRARDKEYTVTRTYRKNLRLLAQLWIGGAGIVAS